jgi:hypothetical protein
MANDETARWLVVYLLCAEKENEPVPSRLRDVNQRLLR